MTVLSHLNFKAYFTVKDRKEPIIIPGGINEKLWVYWKDLKSVIISKGLPVSTEPFIHHLHPLLKYCCPLAFSQSGMCCLSIVCKGQNSLSPEFQTSKNIIELEFAVSSVLPHSLCQTFPCAHMSCGYLTPAALLGSMVVMSVSVLWQGSCLSCIENEFQRN